MKMRVRMRWLIAAALLTLPLATNLFLGWRDDTSIALKLRNKLQQQAFKQLLQQSQHSSTTALAELAAVKTDPSGQLPDVAVYRMGANGGERRFPLRRLCLDAAPLNADVDWPALTRAIAAASERELPTALSAALRADRAHQERPDVELLQRLELIEVLLARHDVNASVFDSLIKAGITIDGQVLPSAFVLMAQAIHTICGERQEQARARLHTAAAAAGIDAQPLQRYLNKTKRLEDVPETIATVSQLAIHKRRLLVRIEGGDTVSLPLPSTLELGGDAHAPLPEEPASGELSPASFTVVSNSLERHEMRANNAKFFALLLAAFTLSMLSMGHGFVRYENKQEQVRRDIVSAVTHELRTPLASMRLQIDAIARTEPERKTKDKLDRLARDVESLDGLVENVLSYARLERGGVKLQRSHLSLRTLCAEVAARQHELTPEASFTLTGDDAEVYADAELLRLVVGNLVANGIRHNARPDGRITIAVRHDGARAIVEVADNGVGVRTEDHERIFRPFERGLSLSRGAGLGLAVSRTIAEQHGGTLALAQTGSEGSVFRLSLAQELPDGRTGAGVDRRG